MKKVKFALTHARGMLAEALMESMADAGIKADSLILLDQQEHAGKRLPYRDTHLTVQDQDAFDYENLTAVLLLEPDEGLASLLQHADCYVISHHPLPPGHRMYTPQMMRDGDWPEPPCYIQLAPAELATLIPLLNLIHAEYSLSQVNAVNVLSAAVYGKSGVEELARQTISLLNSQEVKGSIFPFPLAFNMFATDGDEEPELELFDLMQIDGLKCSMQKILVPAFHGLSTAVVLKTSQNISLKQLTGQIKKLAGIKISSEAVSPATHCKNGSEVYISGLKHPQKDAKRLQFWLTADSVRNGLLQNYLMTMEILLKSHL